jgi:hypothetical protein
LRGRSRKLAVEARADEILGGVQIWGSLPDAALSWELGEIRVRVRLDSERALTKRHTNAGHVIVVVTFACLAAEIVTPFVALLEHDWLYALLLGGRFILPHRGRRAIILQQTARLSVGVFGALTDRLGLALAGVLISFAFFSLMELARYAAERRLARDRPSASAST